MKERSTRQMIGGHDPRTWMNALSAWREHSPQCSGPECSRRLPVWNGVFGPTTGVRTNHGWFCSPKCLEKSLVETLLGYMTRQEIDPYPANRLPLGLFLVSRDQLSEAGLRAAQALQRESGKSISESLRKLDLISEHTLTASIAARWGCPVFPASSVDRALGFLIPRLLLEDYGMMPVHLGNSAKTLFVGFSEDVDYGALYGTEQLLGCRTEPCIISGSTLQGLLREGERRASNDVVLTRSASAAEIARMVSDYAKQLEAQEVRYARVGKYVWIRIRGLRSRCNLLFYREQHETPGLLSLK